MIRFLTKCQFALGILVALAFTSIQPCRAEVNEYTLDNGLRIITVESHTVPIVAVDAWVRAGTRRENPQQPGVAHFLEHLLFKGTPTHPDEESVDGAIEDLGGSLDASTSYDWAHFYTEVPSSGYASAISLLCDILQHASIKSTSVEEERAIILDEISRNNDDPLTTMQDTARSLIYASGSAYSRPITGTADQVRAVSRDQILAFYSTYYVPNNVTIVISGDFNSDDVQKLIVADAGGWKRSDTLPTDSDSQKSGYAPRPTDGPSVNKNLSEQDSNQSYIVMAFDAPSVSAKPDPWDMDVLLTLLGQGGNNRLTDQLKNKSHLVNTISADYLTQKDPGILTVSASMPTANIDAVESEILDQVRQLRTDPVSSAEVEDAKRALRANYLFDVDTDSGHADSLGFYDCIDTYQYDVDYLNNVSKVTAADIQRIAIKYLDPTSYTVVLQVPPSDVTTASAATTTRLAAIASEKVNQ